MNGNSYELVEIGQVCNIKAGGTPSRANTEYFRGNNLWVTISDMKQKYITDTKDKITNVAIKNSNAKPLPNGTVLISIFATLGEVSILQKEATTNQAIAGLIPDITRIKTEYLYYALKSKKSYIKNLGRGIAQRNINLGILKKIRIPLPSLEIQEEIICLINKAENLRRIRQEANFNPDTITKSLFFEMFGNPSLNTKGFNESTLGELSIISMGGTPSTKKLEYWKNGTVNWMKSGDIKDDFIETIPQKITELGLKKSNAKMYKKGDVVIALNGQGKTRATSGILRIETTSNQSVASISPKGGLNSIYLHFNLKYRYQELRDLTGDNQRSGLNLTLLRNLRIIFPPIELQEKFADLVLQMQIFKNKQKESTEEINKIYNSLIEKAVCV